MLLSASCSSPKVSCTVVSHISPCNEFSKFTYLRTVTPLCSLPFWKEESRCLISMSCISPFLQTPEYIHVLMLPLLKSSWSNVRGTGGCTCGDGGLISRAGANPSHATGTYTCQPHWEGLFLCKYFSDSAVRDKAAWLVGRSHLQSTSTQPHCPWGVMAILGVGLDTTLLQAVVPAQPGLGSSVHSDATGWRPASFLQ